jgi:hypothetical protein
MNRRLIVTTLAVAALVSTSAVASFACDKSKTTSAKTASADKAACSYSKATAVTADAKDHCATTKATAVAADSKGACSYSKSAVTASNGACGTKASKAGNVAAAHEGCTVGRATMAVFAGGETGNGKVDAVLAGSSCGVSKSSAGHTASKTGCAICDEYASCDEKLTVAGAVTQVVPLKNGVMFVYTASAENKTHAVQAAVHRRNDRIAEISTAGSEVPLCDGCKSMRGAMASGKLRREVVNIEGGSLTLVTSEDATVVRALQEYSGLKSVKS